MMRTADPAGGAGPHRYLPVSAFFDDVILRSPHCCPLRRLTSQIQQPGLSPTAHPALPVSATF